ncbi:MAG: HAD-IB family phosphatase [Deltaproteobacteria bacterium]|nr:HAD-IB family phosphatase [Deltaproteobacteria bacterium]
MYFDSEPINDEDRICYGSDDGNEVHGSLTRIDQLQLGVFDVDGTLREKRDPWIHLHEHLGFVEEAHEHARMFHDGEIGYEEWVDRDAALWKGFHRLEILAALETNPLKAGAEELLAWFAENKIPIVGISTGLDIFNLPVAERFGFRLMRSNELHFDENGVCLGRATIHVREDGKGRILDSVLAELGIEGNSIVALGDGSADIQLFERAALSIAVSPSKQKIRDAADRCIEDGRIDFAAIQYIKEAFRMRD